MFAKAALLPHSLCTIDTTPPYLPPTPMHIWNSPRPNDHPHLISRRIPFVDNMGIFLPIDYDSFQAFHKNIIVYEQVSRVKLNLSKSMVIPIDASSIPAWLQEIDCILAKLGDIASYQGAPIGVWLPKHKIWDYYLDRVGKYISSWKAKNLSFTTHIILIKQVLVAIPIYHKMYMDIFLQRGCGQVATIMQRLPWVYTNEGKQKTPLVSWERMLASK